VQSANEVAAVFKTSEGRVDALIAFIAGGHSYETPSIVVHRPERVHASYLAWIERETGEAAG
jgi:periplasmic divalent cation tolerance protein